MSFGRARRLPFPSAARLSPLGAAVVLGALAAPLVHAQPTGPAPSESPYLTQAQAFGLTTTNRDRLLGSAGRSAGGSAGLAQGSSEEQEDDARYDAWGAKRRIGLAIGETAGINAFVWGFNEFIRGGNFTQVSPRTWWFNISHGFFFDDNHFSTNMFAHPFHGSLYFNAARTNGLNYWESIPFAIMGSFFWECCGETHLPAWNDWVATSIGGIAMGEMFYRVGSTFLDNEATGSRRTWKEIAGFLLNPFRGFNRLTSGRSGRVYPNPSDPYDAIPPFLSNFIKAGVRIVGDRTTGESFESDTTEVHGFFEFDMKFGSPWLNTRRKPFDFFTLGVQINFNDKKRLGRLQVSGNLYASDMKKTEKVHHVFAITQNYDYINNNAIEFGGQSFGASVLSKWVLSEKLDLLTDVNLHGYLLNAVNSEFAFLAQVPNRERLREYDMGTGAGTWFRFGLAHSGRQIASLTYRLTWVHTLNGSNVNGGDSNHLLHWGGIQGVLPLGRWGIGADVYAYVRRSYFSAEEFGNVKQDVGQLRFYGVYQTFGF